MNSGLNRLKGIACIAVCSGHTLDAFLWYTSSGTPLLERIFRLPILWSVFSGGGISVVVYCLLSDYLAAQSNIENIKVLIKKSIYRYANFFTLLLLCSLCIVVMRMFGLFGYTAPAAELLGNERMTGNNYARTTLLDAFLKAFMLKSYNGAMWMIGLLFYGNVFVYALKWLRPKVNIVFFSLLFVAVLVASYLYQPLVSVTVAGSIAFFYGDFLKKFCIRNKIVSVLLVLISMLFVQRPYFLTRFVPYYVLITPACGLICMCATNILNDLHVFGRPADLLGKYNMVIFSIHIPIIYSLSPFIFCKAYNFGYEPAFWITYGITMLAIFLLAVPYMKFIESNRKKLVAFLKGKLGL